MILFLNLQIFRKFYNCKNLVLICLLNTTNGQKFLWSNEIFFQTYVKFLLLSHCYTGWIDCELTCFRHNISNFFNRSPLHFCWLFCKMHKGWSMFFATLLTVKWLYSWNDSSIYVTWYEAKISPSWNLSFSHKTSRKNQIHDNRERWTKSMQLLSLCFRFWWIWTKAPQNIVDRAFCEPRHRHKTHCKIKSRRRSSITQCRCHFLRITTIPFAKLDHQGCLGAWQIFGPHSHH